jgi:hypothetical protein
LVEDDGCADVSGVDDQIGTLQRREGLRTQEAVGIRDDSDDRDEAAYFLGVNLSSSEPESR